jgi:hypothetical protein
VFRFHASPNTLPEHWQLLALKSLATLRRFDR